MRIIWIPVLFGLIGVAVYALAFLDPGVPNWLEACLEEGTSPGATVGMALAAEGYGTVFGIVGGVVAQFLAYAVVGLPIALLSFLFDGRSAKNVAQQRTDAGS